MIHNFRSKPILMPKCHTCQTLWQPVCLYNIVIFFEKFKKQGNFFSFYLHFPSLRSFSPFKNCKTCNYMIV